MIDQQLTTKKNKFLFHNVLALNFKFCIQNIYIGSQAYKMTVYSRYVSFSAEKLSSNFWCNVLVVVLLSLLFKLENRKPDYFRVLAKIQGIYANLHQNKRHQLHSPKYSVKR